MEEESNLKIEQEEKSEHEGTFETCIEEDDLGGQARRKF